MSRLRYYFSHRRDMRSIKKKMPKCDKFLASMPCYLKMSNRHKVTYVDVKRHSMHTLHMLLHKENVDER